MNSRILDLLSEIDQAFYPELLRMQSTQELLDIYVAKTYLKHIVNKA